MDEPMRNTTVYCDAEDCVHLDDDGICSRGAITLDETGQCMDGE